MRSFLCFTIGSKTFLDRKKRKYWLSYAATLLFPLALLSQNNTSKTIKKPKIVQTQTDNYKSLKIGALHKQGKVRIYKQHDSISITGTVKDSLGNGFPGATVKIVNSDKGTTTDFDGNFKLKLTPKDTIEVSFFAQKTQQVKIKATQRKYNIILVSDGKKHETIYIGKVIKKSN